MSREIIAILDFGSQYGQLIARRVREQNVYSQICRADITAEELSQLGVKGLILSGGPASVYDEKAPRCDEKIFELGVPILGICYGMQLGCQVLGAKIIAAQRREYGRTTLSILEKNDLFANIPDSITAWASHGDQIGELSDDFVKLATTDTCPFAASWRPDRRAKRRFRQIGYYRYLPICSSEAQQKEIFRRSVPS